MREIGTNPTGLTLPELKALRERPDFWAKNLTHGMNNDVYLLKDGVHVVRLAKDRREDNPFRARPLAIAEAMRRLEGHPNIEQIAYAAEDDDEAVVISLYRENLTRLSEFVGAGFIPPAHISPLKRDDVLTTLVEVCAFMDERGVLHKDLCDWNVFFDKTTFTPFLLDFDSMRVIDWTGGNIPLEPMALGFERDSSTLRTETLNIDDLQENFLFEAFFFTYKDDERFGMDVFRRFLEIQRDIYCPRMMVYFRGIGRGDFADMIALRQKKIGEWLASPVKLYKLYLRKRMHFLMRGFNWAAEVAESSEYDVKWFMERVSPALAYELKRRGQLMSTPNALLYADPVLEVNSPAAQNAGGMHPAPTTITLRDVPRIKVDTSETNTFSPDIPKPADTVRMITFGDIHQKVERIARMVVITHAVRQHYLVDVILSLGDVVEGGSDIETALRSVSILNGLSISASALGNHEFDYHDLDAINAVKQADSNFFSNAETPFLHWMRHKANFPFLCINVDDPKYPFMPGALTEWGGKPILLLSAITPAIEHELSYHKRRGFPTPVELRPEHPRDLLMEQVRRVKEKYPHIPFTVVVMSHCGINFDRAELVHPEFDLILGSHTHNLAHLVAEWGDHQTHMIYGGQNAYYLPIVDFTTHMNGRIDQLQYTLIDVDQSKPVYGYGSDERTLGEAQTGFPLEGKSTRSTALLRLVTDAMRTQSGADLAINYGGNVREGLSKGAITEAALAEIMPFPDEAYVVELTAAQIQAVIEYGVWSSRNDVAKKCLMFHPSGFRWSVDKEGRVSVKLPAPPKNRRDAQRRVRLLRTARMPSLHPVFRRVTGMRYRVCVPRYLLEGFGDAFPLTLPHQRGELPLTKLGKSIRNLLTADIERRGVIMDDGDSSRIQIDPAAPLLYNDPTIAY